MTGNWWIDNSAIDTLTGLTDDTTPCMRNGTPEELKKGQVGIRISSFEMLIETSSRLKKRFSLVWETRFEETTKAVLECLPNIPKDLTLDVASRAIHGDAQTSLDLDRRRIPSREKPWKSDDDPYIRDFVVFLAASHTQDEYNRTLSCLQCAAKRPK